MEKLLTWPLNPLLLLASPPPSLPLLLQSAQDSLELSLHRPLLLPPLPSTSPSSLHPLLSPASVSAPPRPCCTPRRRQRAAAGGRGAPVARQPARRLGDEGHAQEQRQRGRMPAACRGGRESRAAAQEHPVGEEGWVSGGSQSTALASMCLLHVLPSSAPRRGMGGMLTCQGQHPPPSKAENSVRG